MVFAHTHAPRRSLRGGLASVGKIDDDEVREAEFQQWVTAKHESSSTIAAKKKREEVKGGRGTRTRGRSPAPAKKRARPNRRRGQEANDEDQAMTIAAAQTLRVGDLRERLQQRGLKTKGLKPPSKASCPSKTAETHPSIDHFRSRS